MKRSIGYKFDTSVDQHETFLKERKLERTFREQRRRLKRGREEVVRLINGMKREVKIRSEHTK